MWLYGERVPGLSQDLEQLVIGQEVESGKMTENLNSTVQNDRQPIIEIVFHSTALKITELKLVLLHQHVTYIQ